MSDQVIFIGVTHKDMYSKDELLDASVSEPFASVDEVGEYLEQLKQKGNKSPEDLESSFIG